MSQDDDLDLDALLRSTLRQEAEPTGYTGGLDQPVFRGVRRRRQRRVAAAGAGGAALLAIAIGAVTMLPGAGDQSIAPAGQDSRPTITVSQTRPVVTHTTTAYETVYSTETGDGSSARSWDTLGDGEPARALAAFGTDGTHTTITWDDASIDLPLVPTKDPVLRTVDGPGGSEYLVVKAHDPGKHPAEGTDDVYLVGKDGRYRLAFSDVRGSVVEAPSGGTPRIGAYSTATNELEVKDVGELQVLQHYPCTDDSRPLTWGNAGIMRKDGTVLDPAGGSRTVAPGVVSATTSGSGTTYAVTETQVIAVTPQGATPIGDVRAGQGTAPAGASPLSKDNPNQEYVATVGGVMDASTGKYIVNASGPVSAIQWVGTTTVMFVLPDHNVRCDVLALRCEKADRQGQSEYSRWLR